MDATLFSRKALQCLLVTFCLLFTACPAKTPSTPTAPPMEDAAQIIWETYVTQQNSLTTDTMPFRLSGSLRFGPEEDTRRVTYILWGNDNQVLRLDVQAGVGASAAKVQQGNGGLLIYLPQENTAYLSLEDQAKALETLGIKLPIALNELALFLRGHSLHALELAINEPTPLIPQATVFTENGIQYTLGQSNRQIKLELSPNATPLTLSFKDGWNLSFKLNEQNILSRVDGQNAEGYSLLLLIKENQNPQPFSPEQLALIVPRDAMVYMLDKPIQQAGQTKP